MPAAPARRAAAWAPLPAPLGFPFPSPCVGMGGGTRNTGGQGGCTPGCPLPAMRQGGAMGVMGCGEWDRLCVPVSAPSLSTLPRPSPSSHPAPQPPHPLSPPHPGDTLPPAASRCSLVLTVPRSRCTLQAGAVPCLSPAPAPAHRWLPPHLAALITSRLLGKDLPAVFPDSVGLG